MRHRDPGRPDEPKSPGVRSTSLYTTTRHSAPTFVFSFRFVSFLIHPYTHHNRTMAVPSYIAVPSCATPISLPRGPSGASAPVPGTAKRSASVSIQTGASGNAYISANLNSGVFPPAAATVASPQRRFTVPTTSSISSNVSDLVLSSLLPPNIPKVAATHTPGRVRELTSQKESLGLNVMSGNFTRFIIKVSALHGDGWVVCPTQLGTRCSARRVWLV